MKLAALFESPQIGEIYYAVKRFNCHSTDPADGHRLFIVSERHPYRVVDMFGSLVIFTSADNPHSTKFVLPIDKFNDCMGTKEEIGKKFLDDLHESADPKQYETYVSIDPKFCGAVYGETTVFGTGHLILVQHVDLDRKWVHFRVHGYMANLYQLSLDLFKKWTVTEKEYHKRFLDDLKDDDSKFQE